MGQKGRRIAWSLGAIALVVAFGIVTWKWGGRIKHEVRERLRSYSSRLALAEQAYRQADWQRAWELSRGVRDARPNDPRAQRIYARTAARIENDQMASRAYGALSKSAKLEPEDYFLMGIVERRAGRSEAALELWTRGAEEQPVHPELLDHLASLALRTERFDQAEGAARVLSHQPGWEARGLLALGDVLDAIERPAEAAEAIRTGLALDPDAAGAYFGAAHYRRLLAQNLLRLGRAAEASAALEAIFASTGLPGADPEASWLYSRALLQEGKPAAAAIALVLAGSFRSLNPLRKEPSPYVGGARCATCHSAESLAQKRTRHAQSFDEGRGLLERGVGCERCHGPGGNHLKAREIGFADPAIVSAGRAGAASVVVQCAECHSVDDRQELKKAPEDPRFVRSTGLTLPLSRCYTESQGGMSCLTCHDPHGDDRGAAASFEAKCLACHSRQGTPAVDTVRTAQPPFPRAAGRAATCRVNPAKDCLSCHMPRITIASLHRSFTDHYIRVRKQDGKKP